MEKVLSQLKEMRLPGMAQTWQRLMESRQATSLGFLDGVRLLVQGERDMRRSNRNARLLHNARFRYDVSLDELAYDSARGLDKAFVTQLSAGEYIRRGLSVIITGATGTGKSWLACAFGSQACRQGYSVIYKSASKLYEELQIAIGDGSMPKYRTALSKVHRSHRIGLKGEPLRKQAVKAQ